METFTYKSDIKNKEKHESLDNTNLYKKMEGKNERFSC